MAVCFGIYYIAVVVMVAAQTAGTASASIWLRQKSHPRVLYICLLLETVFHVMLKDCGFDLSAISAMLRSAYISGCGLRAQVPVAGAADADRYRLTVRRLHAENRWGGLTVGSVRTSRAPSAASPRTAEGQYAPGPARAAGGGGYVVRAAPGSGSGQAGDERGSALDRATSASGAIGVAVDAEARGVAEQKKYLRRAARRPACRPRARSCPAPPGEQQSRRVG